MKGCVFLLRFNLRTIVTDYRKIAVIFLLPLLILAGSGLVFDSGDSIDNPTEKIRLGIVDLERSPDSTMLLGTITGEETISNMMEFESMEEEKAAEKLKHNEITAYIVIPENFSTGLLNMENPPLKLYSNGENLFEFLIVKKTVEGFAKYVNQVEICTSAEYMSLRDMGYSMKEATEINDRISYSLIFKTLGRKSMFETSPVYNFPSVSSFIYHGVSILILLLFFTTTFSALDSMEDRDSGITTKTRMAGVPMYSCMFSKSLAYGIFNTFSTVAILFAFANFSGMEPAWLELTFFILGASFMLNSFWMAAGFAVGDKDSFTSISSVFNVVIAFAGGTFFPVVLLPYETSRIALYSPNLIISKNVVNIMYGNASFHGVLTAFAGCAILGMLFLKIAELLAGRRDAS
ncbi:ABC-type multidrug transport system, permease component [Dethiosulfatibacter aminovorans DSM 17477]|uniref:ABC-type multidrug transport system, permease component n=1 Tax=Dethiosulfatibacter aminovorans DSM 17477 TaxID=1121476 RepID=A0A1M6JEX7_9FIRM|nr:ABC transporter permease [Dethiosulfatibacter aminovorans]SHJ45247.1 ABC-type multidrug transport system, permease component [Dethiosulfatibacter aminovorans DSM 17477]